MVEVNFEEFSKDIKALQQKSDDMSNSIKEVNKLMADEKAHTADKGKKFDQYVAAMTSLMKWLLVQSNLILYIGMLIPLVTMGSDDTSANNQQAKK
jgi:methyl-accepting chemotaxis protein